LYLDLHLEIANGGRLITKLYNKRNYFTFPIVNFPFVSSTSSFWRWYWSVNTFAFPFWFWFKQYNISNQWEPALQRWKYGISARQRQHLFWTHLEIANEGRLKTKLYDKRDYFTFPIVNFPFVSSNIPSSPAYGVYTSQLIRYSRAYAQYSNFMDRTKTSTQKVKDPLSFEIWILRNSQPDCDDDCTIFEGMTST
jgi:hypothetical protein